jgi:hypothetical protein
MNEEDLRDCFAMFALQRIAFATDDYAHGAAKCYAIADAMMEARKPKDETGIAAVKRTRKTK